MTFKQRAVLAGLAIALIPLSACHRRAGLIGPPPGHHFGQEQGRIFGVYIYTDSGQCYADTNAVTIWKSKNQTVQWISDDGNAYLVDFTLGQRGSPFAKATFPVQKDGATPSGPANPESSEYYDYAIRAGTALDSPVCKKATDPGVYVK